MLVPVQADFERRREELCAREWNKSAEIGKHPAKIKKTAVRIFPQINIRQSI